MMPGQADTDRVQQIEARLRRAFAPLHLAVHDESARHVGHVGAASSGGHFRVLIVSAAFRAQDRVSRHRAVYAALGDVMGGAIHALTMETLSPEEWQQRS